MSAPIRAARSDASSRECREENDDGIDTPTTFSPPIASAAITASSAESMPPDIPRTTEENPFLRT